jgi:hypothetical protein
VQQHRKFHEFHPELTELPKTEAPLLSVLSYSFPSRFNKKNASFFLIRETAFIFHVFSFVTEILNALISFGEHRLSFHFTAAA